MIYVGLAVRGFLTVFDQLLEKFVEWKIYVPEHFWIITQPKL